MTTKTILTIGEICNTFEEAGVNSYDTTFLKIDLGLNPQYAQEIGRVLVGEPDATKRDKDDKMMSMLIKSDFSQPSCNAIHDFCTTSQGVGYQEKFVMALRKILGGK